MLDPRWIVLTQGVNDFLMFFHRLFQTSGYISIEKTNSLLLPYVLEFNLSSNLEKFTRIARALGECPDGLSLREGAELVVTAVKQLSQDIGIVTRMRDQLSP